MKFTIKHEIPGRIRIHMEQKQMSYKEADTLLYYLDTLEYVTQAKVYRRTADACVCFSGKRELLIQALRKFRYTSVKVPDEVLTNPGRQLNDIYQEKLIGKVLFHYAGKIFLPYPVRKAVVLWKAVHYLKEGWKSLARRKLEVAVLMHQLLAFLFCEVILIRLLPLCSCWELERPWRSGHIRNR